MTLAVDRAGKPQHKQTKLCVYLSHLVFEAGVEFDIIAYLSTLPYSRTGCTSPLYAASSFKQCYLHILLLPDKINEQ